jgi:hypothetical protein
MVFAQNGNRTSVFGENWSRVRSVFQYCIAGYLSSIPQATAYEASHETNEGPNESDEASFEANGGTCTTHPVADKAPEEQSNT